MASVNLCLPEELQRFVNEQVEVGEFDGASAYIEALIARAKKCKDKLEALLIEGLDSGDPIPMDTDEWNRIRGEVNQRLSSGQ
jgi:antitoxin ParD1/3/4